MFKTVGLSEAQESAMRFDGSYQAEKERFEKEKRIATHLLPWVTAVAMSIQSLDGTILKTSLPVIAREMSYSPTQLHSIIVSYALTLALFIPFQAGS